MVTPFRGGCYLMVTRKAMPETLRPDWPDVDFFRVN